MKTPKGNVDLIELKTAGFVVGGRTDATYYNDIKKNIAPSRLIVFSDGVYEISKEDGSVRSLKEFINDIKNQANEIKSGLDVIESHTRELNQNRPFDDDFTIFAIFAR